MFAIRVDMSFDRRQVAEAARKRKGQGIQEKGYAQKDRFGYLSYGHYLCKSTQRNHFKSYFYMTHFDLSRTHNQH